MHSSRMRTGRSLTVCYSYLPGGGGVCLVPGGFSLAGGFSLPGGGGGVCLVRGVLPGGGSAWSGGVLPAWGGLPGLGAFSLAGGFSLADPPPVNRMTDRCKNITLATTSLRPVIICK